MKTNCKKRTVTKQLFFKILQRHLREAVKKIKDAAVKEENLKDAFGIKGTIRKSYEIKSGRRAFCILVRTKEFTYLISIRKDGFREVRIPEIQNKKIVSEGYKIPDKKVKESTLLSFFLKEAITNSNYFLESEVELYYRVKDVITIQYGTIYSTMCGNNRFAAKERI